jgi:hypothetical protein
MDDGVPPTTDWCKIIAITTPDAMLKNRNFVVVISVLFQPPSVQRSFSPRSWFAEQHALATPLGDLVTRHR